MRYKQSKYPIGAEWEGKTRTGLIVRIWLSEVSDYGWEIWRWCSAYSDGTGGNADWCKTLESCKKDAPSIQGRYKRIK